MKKVLLIEDDVVLRENTAELLELSGYKVETASNGRAGVEVAKKYQPNIIVCDIMMPELDGYGVLDSLSKNDLTKHIPFIFLSAKTERRDVRKGMDLGADDYITKPFNEEELISAIESRMAKAAILNDERQNKGVDEETDGNDEIRTLNDLKNFFDDNGKTFRFLRGDVIYEEGNNSNFIYLIRKGVVKNFKYDHDGKELTTNLYQEDELFGYTSFTQNIPYQESATAIKDCELVGVSKQELKDIIDNNHKITLELIQLLTDNLSGARDQLLDMAYSSVNKKTASTILKFAEKLNNKSGEPIRISRNDLASVAGIATETLIRTLSSFKKDGLIEIEARNIKILDIQRLQQIN
ncbi:MAG: response regulator [Flavobacteriales bacterium]|nr:response regulator [Flavobacteriia bacterium]NCP06696.1 response regulator [Flavobacteriales bacterium]PIV92436.1 MAG: transcriptional regulator [Flavobacteriaceae bacterium CG17_big_fil_post_rev_8_21_14_2_50_33_15]PIY12461.1 MAG: transcriptional regulator [Flavobacteriaceae bacterium CG_4_10_14_3_um_filter_33_47]PJB18032.1 MAG: transcriptional regulator [Flavobacteriaceae bacterium CG_4_9_14_3_um_filter_33_16]